MSTSLLTDPVLTLVFIQITGTIKYNGKTSDEFVLRRTVAYVDQLDYHIPNLTVRQCEQFVGLPVLVAAPARAFAGGQGLVLSSTWDVPLRFCCRCWRHAHSLMRA